MPIYEYQCDGCGHQMEVMQSMKDAALVDCPECQESRLRKRVSAAGFRLKGSGWYVTDFRDGGKKKEAATSKSGSAESAPAATSSSETAPKSSGDTSSATPAAGATTGAAKD